MPQTIRRTIIQEIKMPIRGIILIVIAAVIAAAIAVTGMALFIRKKKKQK